MTTIMQHGLVVILTQQFMVGINFKRNMSFQKPICLVNLVLLLMVISMLIQEVIITTITYQVPLEMVCIQLFLNGMDLSSVMLQLIKVLVCLPQGYSTLLRVINLLELLVKV